MGDITEFRRAATAREGGRDATQTHPAEEGPGRGTVTVFGDPGAAHREAADAAYPPAHVFEPDLEERRRIGQIGALLYILGALTAIPASLLLDQTPSWVVMAILGGALLLGLIWLAFPWERAGRHWFDALLATGTIAIAAAVAVTDRSFSFYFVFAALYAGYMCRTRAQMAGHLSLLTVALLAPIVYDPGSSRETVRFAVMIAPSILLAAGVVTYLRERLEARERMYRGFALEALALARRIQRSGPTWPGPFPDAPGTASTAVDLALEELTERSESLPARGAAVASWVRRPGQLAAGLAAVLLGMTATLAVFGVVLPTSARAPFDAVGITLPNQPPRADEEEEKATTAETAAPAAASQDEAAESAPQPATPVSGVALSTAAAPPSSAGQRDGGSAPGGDAPTGAREPEGGGGPGGERDPSHAPAGAPSDPNPEPTGGDEPVAAAPPPAATPPPTDSKPPKPTKPPKPQSSP